MSSTKLFERGNEMGGDSLSAQIPSLALHDGVIIHRDLSMSWGWTVQLPNTMLAGDGLRANMATLFRSIFNALPQNYDWQFRWVQHARTDELQKLFTERPKADGVAGDITRETERLNVGLMAQHHIAWKEAQIFIVRRPLPAELTKSAGVKQSHLQKITTSARLFLKALSPKSSITEAHANADAFQAMLTDMRGMVETLEPAIAGSGVFPVRISNAAAMRILYEWANKERYEKGGVPATYPLHGGVPLCDLFPLTAFETGTADSPLPPGVFRMGGFYQTMLTLDVPPDELRLGIWEYVLYSGITRMDVTAWGTPLDKAKRVDKLKRALRGMKSQGDSPEKRRQLVELDRELEELGGNTDRLWRMYVSFRLWGDTAEQVVQNANRLMIACEGHGRIALIHERKNPWAFLRSTCPGWTRDCDPARAVDVTTRQAARMLPINGQPAFLRMAPDAVGAVFTTVSSTFGLLNIDPHERSLYNAPHFLISAGTGQGKSVLAASIILELLGSDGRAVMIDRGGSFNGLAAAMGTTPILLTTANKAITLNPLFVKGGAMPDADEIGGILMMLEVMIMSAAQKEGRLPGDESRVLRDQLQRLFESKPGVERTLGELRDSLASVQAGRWLSSQLSAWCAGGGDYGTMFDGLNNIPLGSRLTVIDLGQDVRGNNQALTNVLTMLIISIVSQLMTHGGVRRKYVIFDEAGVLAKNKAQADFLEYAYRTFRKTGTGVGALTQKAMDLASLFSYAPLKFFLRQDDLDDTREAAKQAGFSEETVAYIRDLQTRPGEFADFVVVQKTQTGTQSHICRNYVTPLKYAMVTSDKDDTYAMNQIMKDLGCERAGAMKEFARRYPRGVAYARSNPQANTNQKAA